jgi:peptidoglycan glycosyltransferase
MISPFHGAVMASIVGNNGYLKRPSLLSEVKEVESGKTVWKPQYQIERVLSEDSAEEMKELMTYTVKRGTARSAFSRMKWKWRKSLEIGGKTGTITGGVPYGKRDWFVSYAKPIDSEVDSGISVSVMIVNKEKWYVKSAYLANLFIQYYYDQKAKSGK